MLYFENRVSNRACVLLALALSSVSQLLMAGEIYVASQEDNQVRVIDTQTQQELAAISVGRSPLGMAWDGRTGMYVANSLDNTVNVIDISTFQVSGTVAVGSYPLFMASDGGTGMYVANYRDNNVSVIDTDKLAVVKVIPVGSRPYGVASNGGTGIYVTNWLGDTVSVIDASKLAVVNTIPVGDRPSAISWDGEKGMYVINYSDNTVSVIDTEKLAVVDVIYVGHDPYVLGWDGEEGMYVGYYNDQRIHVIDTQQMQIVDSLNVGNYPSAIVSDGGTGLYVANTLDNNVNLINSHTLQVSGTVATAKHPVSLALVKATVNASGEVVEEVIADVEIISVLLDEKVPSSTLNTPVELVLADKPLSLEKPLQTVIAEQVLRPIGGEKGSYAHAVDKSSPLFPHLPQTSMVVLPPPVPRSVASRPHVAFVLQNAPSGHIEYAVPGGAFQPCYVNKPIANLNRGEPVVLKFENGEQVIMQLREGCVRSPSCPNAVIVANHDHSVYRFCMPTHGQVDGDSLELQEKVFTPVSSTYQEEAVYYFKKQYLN